MKRLLCYVEHRVALAYPCMALLALSWDLSGLLSFIICAGPSIKDV